MASGRCSSDSTDLLLVDPSQPEATKQARRHLTKRQKDIFLQYGFSKALLREVIVAGWDQVDINNYFLYYNSQVETRLAMPAPSLDMSMKKSINTIIRTKLQEPEEEREVGLLTPLNPKGPSTGDPPEPDPGMLPLGPRKTTGGKGKPSTSLRSVRELQEELKRVLVKKKEEQRAAQAAKAAKAAKKSSVKAPKGGVKRLHRF